MQVTWTTYHVYDRATVDAYAPSSAGMYVLWVKLKNGDWRVFYVGRCADVKDRLKHHLGTDEENECIKTHVSEHICGLSWAEVGRQQDRNGAEKYLFDQYEPECNSQDPGGTPISVNPPPKPQA